MRPGHARSPLLVVVTLVAAASLLSGCRVTFGDRMNRPTERNSVSASVQATQRFEVDFAGSLPTREQVGLGPGDTMQNFNAESGDGLAFVARLAGGRTFTTPASSVTISTTDQFVNVPRSPGLAPDDQVLPNKIAATQDFTTKDEGLKLLQDQAATLGLDAGDIDVWYRSAPEKASPQTRLDRYGVSGKQKIGYLSVGATIIMSDLAYIIWEFTWDPPIPGYTYDSDGIPHPTSS